MTMTWNVAGAYLTPTSAWPPDSVLSYVATPSQTAPTYLNTITDQTFGGRITKIYDSPNVVHTYSKRQAWNPSETKIMLGLGAGFNRALISGIDYSVINAAVGGDGQWWTDTELIRANTASRLFFTYNPTTNTNTGTLHDFSAVWASDFDFMTQSSPSDDLRYWLLKGTTGGGQSQVAVWDATLDSIISTLNVTTLPHSGSMSHSGDYIHINWNATGTGDEQGIQIFDRSLTRIVQADIQKGHLDFQYSTVGDEVLVVQPRATLNSGALMMYRCADGQATIVLTGPSGLGHGHVSGRNNNRHGWAYCSTYDSDTVPNPGTDQVFAVKLDGSGTVQVFCHSHVSTSPAVAEPHATVNRAGTKVLVDTDWGGTDTYEYIVSAT